MNRLLSRKLALATLLFFNQISQGAAPPQTTQAPGYYRMMLGDFEVTSLLDGTFPMPVDKVLGGLNHNQLQKLLERSFEEAQVPTSVNGFLINTGSKLVLVDTGTGSFMGPSMGRLVGNLKASGYPPEQVDEIYITHMHPDHVGGLISEGKRTFPNAVVRANQIEGNFWLDTATKEKEKNPEKKAAFDKASSALKPYVDAGKYKPFEGETELVPGIKSLPLAGHTPGHSGYIIESKGKKLVLLGDLLHVAAVQFAEPSATMHFDTDGKTSAAERKKIFALAAKEKFIIGSAHLSFPGMGHVRQETKNFSFVPIDYVALK